MYRGILENNLEGASGAVNIVLLDAGILLISSEDRILSVGDDIYLQTLTRRGF